MNKCVICKKEFLPPSSYPNKKTCSKECYSLLLKKLCKKNEKFNKNKFEKGREPFNKNKPRADWMNPESEKICKRTEIQKVANSKYGIYENRFLPLNTYPKGTVTKRTCFHTKGKNKDKFETEYYINIDWKGNRKPNNLYKRYIWEVYNQRDVPKGYVIYRKDGNIDNLDINNLELISRGELARRNRYGLRK